MAQRLTDEQRLLRTITEARFQSTVQKVMSRLGWKWFHPADNKPTRGGFIQNTRAGFPDLVAVRGNRVLYAELKREGPQGKVSPDQVEWIAALRRAGQECYIWRPSNMDELTEILTVLSIENEYPTATLWS